MNAYKNLIERIYPARNGEKTDIQLYHTMEVAHIQMQNLQNINDFLLYNYRTAFFFLITHICNAIQDGTRRIFYELNEFDKKCLDSFIKKLNGPLYDKIELDEIIMISDEILSNYDLKKNTDYDEMTEFKAIA